MALNNKSYRSSEPLAHKFSFMLSMTSLCKSVLCMNSLYSQYWNWAKASSFSQYSLKFKNIGQCTQLQRVFFRRKCRRKKKKTCYFFNTVYSKHRSHILVSHITSYWHILIPFKIKHNKYPC